MYRFLHRHSLYAHLSEERLPCPENRGKCGIIRVLVKVQSLSQLEARLVSAERALLLLGLLLVVRLGGFNLAQFFGSDFDSAPERDPAWV